MYVPLEREVYRVDKVIYLYLEANTTLCVGRYTAWIMWINKTKYILDIVLRLDCLYSFSCTCQISFIG